MPQGGLAGPAEARTRQVEANPLNAVGPFATSRRRAILRSPLGPQSQGASTHVYHALCKVIWMARMYFGSWRSMGNGFGSCLGCRPNSRTPCLPKLARGATSVDQEPAACSSARAETFRDANIAELSAALQSSPPPVHSHAPPR
jgi:hypothetical protein